MSYERRDDVDDKDLTDNDNYDDYENYYIFSYNRPILL